MHGAGFSLVSGALGLISDSILVITRSYYREWEGEVQEGNASLSSDMVFEISGGDWYGIFTAREVLA